MKYTTYSTPELFDDFYCSKVSHHYFWFKTYREQLEFRSHEFYDSRMTESIPAK